MFACFQGILCHNSDSVPVLTCILYIIVSCILIESELWINTFEELDRFSSSQ